MLSGESIGAELGNSSYSTTLDVFEASSELPNQIEVKLLQCFQLCKPRFHQIVRTLWQGDHSHMR